MVAAAWDNSTLALSRHGKCLCAGGNAELSEPVSSDPLHTSLTLTFKMWIIKNE